MTRKEAERLTRQADALRALGFTRDEAEALRRISMTLRRWYELECGNSDAYRSWAIERDDDTEKPYMVTHAHHGPPRTIRTAIADREKGAVRRLQAIVNARNARRQFVAGQEMPGPIEFYLQTDPRGAALYLIRPGDVPEGGDVSGYYTRGVCVS